jgi:allantoin racemase
MNPQPIRIAWQSSRPIEKFPAYVKALEEHAARYLAPGSSVSMRGTGFGPPHLEYQVFDFLNNIQVLKSVAEAEREGFDVVAIGCVLDPILDELREAVDIPIVSYTETAMRVATTLGHKFSILTHNRHISRKYVEQLVVKNGMERWCAGVVDFDLSFEALEEAMKGSPQECERLTAAAAEQAVRQGAEVIIMGCGLMNLLAMRYGWHRFSGAPVLDVTGCLVKSAEMMVMLRRIAKVEVSRVGYYARPTPAEMDSLYAQYGLIPAQPALRAAGGGS